jgi:DNA-binding response OmpR family regulator
VTDGREGERGQKKARYALGRRLLIIDDDAGVQKMLRILLEYEHFEVVIASNGQMALEYLDHTLPDLILLDLMMPHMDGQSFMQALKMRGLRPSLPVIVLTADIYAKSLIEAMDVDRWLIKPFHLSDLLRQVKELLAAREREMSGPGQAEREE